MQVQLNLTLATNTLRLQFMNKYNLDKFEFSQNFIFFYDKLEKCNFFLENLIQLSSSEPNPKSRSIQSLFSSAVGDGGFWDEAVNIIEKYGLVPQTEFPNTKHSINSKELNWIINNLLRGYGIKIRNEILVNKLDYDSIHVIKNGMMSDIYRVLVTTLGSPPTKFDWKFRDKNGKFKIHPNQTPLSFYNDFLKKSIGCSVKDMVSVAHNPTVALYSISISPYSGNVFSMRRQTTTNVPISILKKIAIEMIRKGDPVYFTCDVTEFFVKAKGLLDIRAVNYEAGFGVDVIGNMTKAERMEYGESYATHAMALTGVDVNQETGKIEQWRVENSWGSRDLFLGYLVMTDEWFDEFVYSVVCKDEILRKLRVDKLVKRCGIVNESPVWD